MNSRLGNLKNNMHSKLLNPKLCYIGYGPSILKVSIVMDLII